MPEKFEGQSDSLPVGPATEMLLKWDAAYDKLDAQGRMNAAQIHEELAPKFFGNGVSAEAGLADLRRRALLEKEAIAKVPDSVAKILETPVQRSLFEDLPLPPESAPEPAPEAVPARQERLSVPQSNVTQALAPKSEGELNYEHFEAAFRTIQASGAGRSDYVVFDTVVDGKPAKIRIPWLVATTIVKPKSRRACIVSLLRYMYPDVPVE